MNGMKMHVGDRGGHWRPREVSVLGGLPEWSEKSQQASWRRWVSS